MTTEIEPGYLPWQSDLLERALSLKKQQHLPHAIMIESASNQSIGNFVWYLAMLLLCDETQNVSLCGQCEACRMMRAGTYADFSFVTLEPDEKSKKISKNIKIEQIRKLIHEISLTSHYARLKIAVIYPAEKMNKASANALLKTLEEPGAQVLLLLATHNKGRIPITIRSRCQSWTVNLPSRDSALTWLAEQGIAGDQADRYLDYAAGDPVLALDLKQQDYASLVEQFKSRFGQFIRGELSVVAVCSELLSFDTNLIRRLINMTLSAYCYQMSGVDAHAKSAAEADRVSARALLSLQLQAQSQLQVEENNLDFQLQLEDLLISLKQILTRRLI